MNASGKHTISASSFFAAIAMAILLSVPSLVDGFSGSSINYSLDNVLFSQGAHGNSSVSGYTIGSINIGYSSLQLFFSNTSAASPACGDGVKNGVDECDGGDFGGMTCQALGYAGGSLSCSGSCSIIASNCIESGGSGGSSGSGAETVQDAPDGSPIESDSHLIGLPDGEARAIAPDLDDFPLEEIAITATESVNAQIVFNKLDSLPAGMPSPEGEVYMHFSVTHSVADASIASVALSFIVDKQWLSDAGLDPRSVRLHRFTSVWNELTTTLRLEDAARYHYSAVSPGMSYFTITAKKLELAPVPTEEERPAPLPQPPKPTPSTPEQAPPAPEPTPPSPTPAPAAPAPPVESPASLTRPILPSAIMILLAISASVVIVAIALRSLRKRDAMQPAAAHQSAPQNEHHEVINPNDIADYEPASVPGTFSDTIVEEAHETYDYDLKRPAPNGKSFYLHDGQLLRSIEDLAQALLAMNAAVFFHHVTPYHNDFSAWTRDVFGYEELALELSLSKNVNETLKCIERFRRR